MKILFVCTGNICRSPMGEALLRHRLVDRAEAGTETEVDVSSTGTWGLAGEPATAHAVSVLADLGVDAARHRARALDPEELEAADLILVMTSVHLREIEKAAPGVMGKVRLLKELAEIEPPDPGPGATPADRVAALLGAPRPSWRRELDLDDPMGLPRGVYERCAAQVSAAVDQLIGHLFPEGPQKRGEETAAE